MIRTALLRSSRSASKAILRSQTPVSRTIAPSSYASVARTSHAPQSWGLRFYSAPAGLAKPEVEGRIMDILKNFDKVSDASKLLQLSNTSHFANDLGLDSLDTVEVVMAIEEEFSIEIPDKEADQIHSIDKAVEYILAQPDGMEMLQSLTRTH
ncbi:MAG: Acyl carrier protein, mitochondrial [Stictis urceolatum]|nr:Acyl carrier protein, mitochondrial [Stictis urceolata]